MKELAAALVAAQKEMPAVEKTAKANYGMYATLDHLISKTRPVLNKHGLAVTQFPSVSELGAPTLVTRLVHVSGESLEYEMPLLLPPERQGMQVLGAAITYARRYALSAALGIASESDDDGAAATSDVPATTKPASNGQKVISEAQRKRLFAIAKEAAVAEAALKKLVLDVTGAESTSAIPVAKYDELVAAVQSMDVPF